MKFSIEREVFLYMTFVTEISTHNFLAKMKERLQKPIASMLEHKTLHYYIFIVYILFILTGATYIL